VQPRGPRKKLEAAALHWLGKGATKPQPIQVDDSVAAGMRVFGASDEAIAKARAEIQSGADDPGADAVFEVHEDAWESWRFFLRVQRQWLFVPVTRAVGMGGVVVDAQRMSLNWSGVRSMVMLTGVKKKHWSGLVDDLLVIESAVLGAERKAKEAG